MDKDVFNTLSNMLNNNYDSSKENTYNFVSNAYNNDSSQSNDNLNNFDFSNIDMGTVMKIKNIMDNINSKKNDSRENLLLSLKPYLKPSRKEKLDQYINLLKISSVLEIFNSMGGENKK
jgi:hypothetical protein